MSTRIALHKRESAYIDLPSVQRQTHITAVYKHLGGITVSNGSMSREAAHRRAAQQQALGPLRRTLFRKSLTTS